MSAEQPTSHCLFFHRHALSLVHFFFFVSAEQPTSHCLFFHRPPRTGTLHPFCTFSFSHEEIVAQCGRGGGEAEGGGEAAVGGGAEGEAGMHTQLPQSVE